MKGKGEGKNRGGGGGVSTSIHLVSTMTCQLICTYLLPSLGEIVRQANYL